MTTLYEGAYAKLNLTLDVLGKREDGYHDLRMVMQTVELSDTLNLQPGQGQGIRVRSNVGFLPADEHNLAAAAALASSSLFSLAISAFFLASASARASSKAFALASSSAF